MDKDGPFTEVHVGSGGSYFPVIAVIGQPAMVMKMMSDPVIMSALRNPHITKAYMEFTRDPSAFARHKVRPRRHISDIHH